MTITEQQYDGKLFYEDSQMSTMEVDAMTTVKKEERNSDDVEYIKYKLNQSGGLHTV